MTKYKVAFTKRYTKGYKLAKKQGKDMGKLKKVILCLASGEVLPPKYKDHKLKGDEKAYRECHIEGDWLLKYRIERDELILVLCDTGSHADVLGI